MQYQQTLILHATDASLIPPNYQVTALLIPGLSYASSLTVAMITVNRAAAIIAPHNYRSKMTFRMSVIMVCGGGGGVCSGLGGGVRGGGFFGVW